jgi:hypothetical protein
MSKRPLVLSTDLDRVLARPAITRSTLLALRATCVRRIEDAERFTKSWPALAQSWRHSLARVDARLKEFA